MSFTVAENYFSEDSKQLDALENIFGNDKVKDNLDRLKTIF